MHFPKASRPWFSFAVAIVVFRIAGPVLAGSTSIAVGDPVSNGFIENRGQIDARVLYYASGPRGGVYLTRDAIVLDLADSRLNAKDDVQTLRRQGRVVWLRFESADPTAVIDRVGRLPARFNYFYGPDPARWETDVAAYQQIIYRNLWPGADLVCSIDAGRVGCSILTASGADRGRSTLSVRGRDARRAGGDRCALDRPRLLATTLPAPARDDPSRLVWSTFLGGTSEELAWSVALDADRNPVVAGLTISSHFPTTPGAYDTTYAGLGDVFVAKLDASGSDLLWSTYLGGTATNLDYGYAVVLDSGRPDRDRIHLVGGLSDHTVCVRQDIQRARWTRSSRSSPPTEPASSGAPSWEVWTTTSAYAVTLDSQKNPVIAGRTLS